MIKNDGYDKVSKAEMQSIDNQFTTRIQEVFNTVTEVNLEKETQRKKTLALDRKVSKLSQAKESNYRSKTSMKSWYKSETRSQILMLACSQRRAW